MDVERAKQHLRENKKFYVGVVCGAVIAGFTCVVMRKSSAAQGGACESNAQGALTNTAFPFSFGNRQNITVTTVLDREGRGHPGWPVRNLETKRIFFSQREAASAFEIPENLLSGHLNGKFPDVDGLHFERVNLTSL